MKYLSPILFVLVASMPFAASAATYPPYCSVLTKTADGQFWPMINNKLYLIAQAGEPITIIWGSANATTAYSDQGPIGFTGQQVVVPSKTTAYAFHFSSGSQQATCTVTAVVFGSVGVAQGSVTSNPTTTTTINTFPAQPVTVTTSPSSSTSTPSTASFSVSEIPLLSGGHATPGSSVPVQYIKLVNTSSSDTTLPGIWVKQSGTAPVTSIIGFTSVDDKAILRSSIGGQEGSTPFQNGLAFIPLNASFAPGQFRIFTIKAMMSRNLSSLYGTTLNIKTAKLDTTGSVAASPILGTTWTLSAQ